MRGSAPEVPRIAYIVGTYPNITETFVHREIKSLRDSGLEVNVFAVKRAIIIDELALVDSPEKCFFARPENIVRHLLINVKCLFTHPFRYIFALKPFFSKIGSFEPNVFARILYHFFCGIGFTEIIIKFRINHLHCHFTSASNIALAINGFIGTSFSFTAHASGDIFVKPVLMEEKVRSAKFVVAVCDYSKKYLDSITGYKYSNKIVRIYNGVDQSETEVVPHGGSEKSVDRLKKHIRLVSVGRLLGCKGYVTLLQTCKILKDKGIAVFCTIVGDGPDRENIERLIVEWGLDSMLIVRGFLSHREVYQTLLDSDVFVLLSEIHENGKRDGFPTVILEAMLVGLPVVATCLSGIPEMVLHEVTGLLVNERSPEQAALAIEKLACNPEMRRRFGEAGRTRTVELFDARKNLRNLTNLFY